MSSKLCMVTLVSTLQEVVNQNRVVLFVKIQFYIVD